MSVATQYKKIKALIPYVKEKLLTTTGEEIVLEAELNDKFWVKDLLNKDKVRRDQAVEVFFRNIGTDDFLSGITAAVPHVFHGATTPTPTEAPNLEIAAKCIRKLDALFWLSTQPGFFKAQPVLDSVGEKLFDYASGQIIATLDPVDLTRLKKEGVI